VIGGIDANHPVLLAWSDLAGPGGDLLRRLGPVASFATMA
jgi:hypothetical protein